MSKTVGGFLIGFFLAVFIMMAAIKVEVGPLEPELRFAQSATQIVYDITHGSTYGDITSLAQYVNKTADKLSNVPLIGNLLPNEVSATTASAVLLLTNAKASSESTLNSLQFTIFLLQISVPMMIVSVIFLAIGGYLIAKEKGMLRIPDASVQPTSKQAVKK